MIKSSDRVKAWRKNVKLRAIEAGGGKCQLCGYNFCPEALEFHHIDPSIKEFSFGKIIANPKSQIKIAKELEKCMLLCSNCHREFHSGYKELPLIFVKFNTDIFLINNKVKQDECPICGKLKPCCRITCSRQCAAKKSNKVNWESIDLYDLKINQKLPNTKIAMLLNISDGAVKKRLVKLGLT